MNIDNLLNGIYCRYAWTKANPNRQAKGTVIEAKLDKDRGPIATILVQRGTLNHGFNWTETLVGRVRAMTDKGQRIKSRTINTCWHLTPEVPEAEKHFMQ